MNYAHCTKMMNKTTKLIARTLKASSQHNDSIELNSGSELYNVASSDSRNAVQRRTRGLGQRRSKHAETARSSSGAQFSVKNSRERCDLRGRTGHWVDSMYRFTERRIPDESSEARHSPTQ